MLSTTFPKYVFSNLLWLAVCSPTLNAATASYVYTMTNAASGNSILVFQRETGGTLTFVTSVPTGGRGSGGAPGSQGTLLLQGNYLFAVNPGNSTITTLNANTMTVLSSVSSGGTSPVSLTFHKGFLYVLNDKGVNNITGFTADAATGVLTALPGSTQPLSAASVGPAEVAFNAAGTELIVTEKNTSLIDVFPVTDGVAGPPTSYASAGITPYGFAVSGHDWFFVSDAQTGVGTDSGAVSSYQLSSTGVPSVISGVVALTSLAPCWVAVNAAETYVYVANNGSNTISQLTIGSNGSLTLVSAYGTGPSTGPADLAISPDGLNLYAVDSKSGAVDAFTINSNGSLTRIAGASGTSAAHAGLVVR